MTQNATSNRVAVRYVAESTFGTTPSTPALKDVRYTDESLNYNISYTTSKEIRSDRNVANLIATKASSQGDIGFELSAASFDDFFEAALCSNWAIVPQVIENCEDAWNEISNSNVTATADATDKQYGSASAKFVVAGAAAAGEILATEAITASDLSECSDLKLWIKSSVVTSSGDLRILLDNTAACVSPLENLQVPALVANTWTEVTLPLAAAVSDTAIISIGLKQQVDLGACTVWIDHVRKVPTFNTIKNGTTLHSFTIQKHFQDIAAPVFANFMGQRVGSMSLDFKVGSILTGKFGFMGLNATASTSQIAGATIVSAGTSVPMNSVTNVQNILENGSATTSSFKSVSLNLDNALRPQEAIGSLYPIGIALGTSAITGNIEAYFSDLTVFNRYLNDTSFAISFMAKDALNNYYRVTLPAVKLETYKLNSSGLDTDVMMSGTWRAFYDSVSECMIQIDRVLV